MKKILIAFAFLLLSSLTFAQVDRTKRPAPGPAPVVRLGKYESFTLANGMKVFVVTNKKLPRVAVNLVLDYVPPLEKDAAGLAEVTGQLLRTGTATRTKDQIDEQIDFLGASLSTSGDGAYGTSLKKYQDRLVEIMADVLLNPAFKQDELDKIKTEKKNELSLAKDQPESIMQRVRGVVLYGKDHPYGEITTAKTIDNITTDRIRQHYNTYFRPNIAYVAFVGDITLAEARALTEKHFAKWQRGNVPAPSYAMPKAPAQTRVVLVDKPGAVQTVLSVAYPVDFKPGGPDAIKAGLANDIFGYGGFSGRLFQNLREKRGYTYGAYSALRSNRLVGSFGAGGSIKTNVMDSAVAEILGEMRRIRDQAVTSAELQQTKNIRNGTFVQSLESPQTIASFALNTARYKLPADYYANYLKNVAAVSVADVQAMSRKYILPDNAYIIAVGDASVLADKLKQFGPVERYDAEGNKTEANAAATPAGLTADQVIANYVAAIGGKENLLKIRDMTTNLAASVQGMEIVGVQQRKIPNKVSMSMKIPSMGMEAMKLTSNGSRVMVASMGNSQEMQGAELEAAKVMNTMFAELQYDQLGVKRTLAGTEKVNGTDTYKLELELPGGSKVTEYYDTKTGLKIRQIATQASGSQTTDFSDYREVAGVKFPYLLNTTFGPQTVELKVTSVEVNKMLGDDLFEVK
ncbi:MAG: insulinase family protein [Cytophagales bacterium]|nr:insulinase family protein [Cytophagales bacterium]